MAGGERSVSIKGNVQVKTMDLHGRKMRQELSEINSTFNTGVPKKKKKKKLLSTELSFNRMRSITSINFHSIYEIVIELKERG